MYQQPPYGYVPPPPARSAIPKVIGILMIIFGCLGLLGSLINFAGGFGQAELMRQIPEWGKLKTLTTVTSVLSLVMAIFQLYVGIRCVGYKPNAPTLARIYGIVGIINVIVGMVIAFAVINPILDKAPAMRALGGGFTGIITVVASLLSVAWVIVILTLMGKQSAKDACAGSAPPVPAPLPQARVL
jgi:hypothetical protein